MQRWQRMNVYFSLIGLFVFIICIIFVKKVPVLLLPAAFALGIAFNCFKTIYKKLHLQDLSKRKSLKMFNQIRKIRRKKAKKIRNQKSIYLQVSKWIFGV